MNQEIFRGKWEVFRNKVQEWWDELTDADLDQIDGHWDRLAILLQDRYGYSRERAEAEIQPHWDNFENESPESVPSS